MTRSVLLVLLSAACGLSLGACNTCGLVGCGTALTVRFVDGSGTVIRELEGTIDTGAGPVAFRCSDGTGPAGVACADGVLLFETASPAKVRLSVQATGRAERFEGELAPTYAEHFPNGPDCDPEPCRQASVDVTLR